MFGSYLLPKAVAGVDGIELESKGPTLGTLIVAVKNVEATHVLPFVHRFLDGREIEEREECAFTSSQVALD